MVYCSGGYGCIVVNLYVLSGGKFTALDVLSLVLRSCLAFSLTTKMLEHSTYFSGL